MHGNVTAIASSLSWRLLGSCGKASGHFGILFIALIQVCLNTALLPLSSLQRRSSCRVTLVKTMHIHAHNIQTCSKSKGERDWNGLEWGGGCGWGGQNRRYVEEIGLPWVSPPHDIPKLHQNRLPNSESSDCRFALSPVHLCTWLSESESSKGRDEEEPKWRTSDTSFQCTGYWHYKQ